MRPLVAALVAVFLCLPTGLASAQQPRCGPESAVLAALARDYEERPIADFMDQRGTLIRLLVNMETRTWTLLSTGPGGKTCLIGFGENFEPRQPAPADEDPAS